MTPSLRVLSRFSSFFSRTAGQAFLLARGTSCSNYHRHDKQNGSRHFMNLSEVVEVQMMPSRTTTPTPSSRRHCFKACARMLLQQENTCMTVGTADDPLVQRHQYRLQTVSSSSKMMFRYGDSPFFPLRWSAQDRHRRPPSCVCILCFSDGEIL